MAGSIPQPGIEVEQEFVEEIPTEVEPSLPTVLVGPCFQVVDAFDDLGNLQPEALAGTYADGVGTVAYDLPGLKDQADLTGFDDEVRVWLAFNNNTTELNSEADESVLAAGTLSLDYTQASGLAEDVGQTFTQLGVLAGDYLRVTWRGVVYDIIIESVDSDTQLTVDNSVISENLTNLTYEIVRNPAQFVISTQQQASLQVGTEANFLQFSLKASSAYAGSAGDALAVSIEESEKYEEGTDAATGQNVFRSATASFLTSVGAVGTSTGFYVFSGAAGASAVLRDILSVVSDTTLTIEDGEAASASGLTYVVGSEAATGADGAVTTLTTFTSAGAAFNTTIPNAAGTPTTTTFIEIEGDGVYTVASVDSDTQLTLTQNATNATGLSYTVITQTATAADGATAANTTLVSASASFDTAIPTPVTAHTVIIAGTAYDVASVVNAKEVTLDSGVTGSALSYAVTAIAADLAISWDPDLLRVVVQLERALGISSSTYAEIQDAVANVANPAYNETVAAITSAALGGTVGDGAVAVTASDVAVLSYDGGADTDDLLLDADLIGSTTPTASVYVSYRALRVDVSAGATNPVLLSFNNPTAVADEIGPLTTENPLGLAYFFALANSPTNSVKGIGVSAVSASEPQGSQAAYAEAFSFLQAQDVYCVVPLTQAPLVHQLLDAHVTSMSLPENKSERIGFFNTDLPEYATATVVASGVDGNTGTIATITPVAPEFTANVNFAAAGVVAGDILVVGAIAGSDASPQVADGTQGPLYGVRVASVKTGDNFTLVLNTDDLDTDAVGAPANLTSWNNLVDVTFTVYRAGALITSLDVRAEAVANVGESYLNRRMFHIWPDEVTATIDGSQLTVDGYYLAAGWGGKNCSTSPEQGYTNSSVNGYLSLNHSNGYFSRPQLDRIAGGGTMISIQETARGAVTCRHQLSTDVSSLSKQELSITKQLDYAAKFLRLALKGLVGRFNITQSFLDALSTSIQGLLRQLVDAGRLIDARLQSIAENPNSPGTIDIVIVVEAGRPANYFAIKLLV